MTDLTLENKQLDFSFEVKAINDEGMFSGYASIFDVVDSQQDVILKGAFERTLRERGVASIKMLWQHRVEEPIGYFTHVEEDAMGLYVEGKLLLDVQKSQEAYGLLKKGAISGLSIGYSVRESEVDYNEGIRYIHDVDLWEVSLVTFPANQHATVLDVKGGIPQNIRQFERFLRESGFSRSQAKVIASKGFHFAKNDECEEDTITSTCLALDKCMAILSGSIPY